MSHMQMKVILVVFFAFLIFLFGPSTHPTELSCACFVFFLYFFLFFCQRSLLNQGSQKLCLDVSPTRLDLQDPD